jgi:hypothetical protein
VASCSVCGTPVRFTTCFTQSSAQTGLTTENAIKLPNNTLPDCFHLALGIAILPEIPIGRQYRGPEPVRKRSVANTNGRRTL